MRRKTLRKQIFELSIRFETEKIKYPEWFQNRYIARVVRDLERLKNYSDEQLDHVAK